MVTPSSLPYRPNASDPRPGHILIVEFEVLQSCLHPRIRVLERLTHSPPHPLSHWDEDSTSFTWDTRSCRAWRHGSLGRGLSLVLQVGTHSFFSSRVASSLVDINEPQTAIVNKTVEYVLEQLTHRTNGAWSFLASPKLSSDYHIVPIQDAYGPTAVGPNIQALAVDKDTPSGTQRAILPHPTPYSLL